MRVTLSEIAAKAGVSTATVSRILNGNESDLFARETCQKVLDTARRLRSGPRAVTQRTRRRIQRVSVVCDFALVGQTPGNFFTQVFDGVLREGRQRSIQIELASECLDAQRKIEAILQAHALGSGVLLCGVMEPEVFDLIVKTHVPAVYIGDSTIPVGRLSSVECDNWNGGKLAADHLASLGHRRIAYVTQELHSTREYSTQRLSGFWMGLHLAGLNHNLVQVVTHKQFDDLPAVLDQVMACDQPPTAIFCDIELAALVLLEHFNQRDIRVPRDISVVGFDDFPISALKRPALTSVHVPRDRIGQIALRTLIQSTDDPAPAPTTELVPVGLMVRESTGPASDKPVAV